MKIIKETQEDVILTIEISKNQLKRLIRAVSTTSNQSLMDKGIPYRDVELFCSEYRNFYTYILES